jgi:hypothetical protein
MRSPTLVRIIFLGALLFSLALPASAATCLTGSTCTDWVCGGNLNFGANSVSIQLPPGRYYSNTMHCTATCTCPAGTDYVRLRGKIDIQPDSPPGTPVDYVLFAGKKYDDLIPAFEAQKNASTVQVEFFDDGLVSNCESLNPSTGGIVASFLYGGVNITSVECLSRNTTMSLDVGNDTDYEWNQLRSFRGPERVDFTESLKRYVRGGCWCRGCVLEPVSGNCTVPIVFKSKFPGNLTVNDVWMNFSRSAILGSIDYGLPYRKAEGGCWRIKYAGASSSGQTDYIAIPSGYSSGDCTTAPPTYKYDYPVATQPFSTDDAIDDAVFRLLNQSLDTDKDGRINVDYNLNMSFDADGKMGVQSMWGPVQMRLIVWS